MPYVGRFAPSPTGPLHFGSLVAALASWLDARSSGGSWLVRIEDLDRPRVMPGAATQILRQLESFGMSWDGAVMYQSQRDAHYREALSLLGSQVYPCACSRRELEDSALSIDGARIYPGTCRDGFAPGKSARAWRIRTTPAPIAFEDRVQGRIERSVEREVGDFVVLRADGHFAYQLAVVVDDAEQGVTDVVRGADLLDSTARQIHLQRLLGFDTPRYLHFPVAVNADGEKLSKQTAASRANSSDITVALGFLGVDVPEHVAPSQALSWAVDQWKLAKLPPGRVRSAPSSVAR
jgi:glutamyl-Q tRNA(Asp) synthetase